MYEYNEALNILSVNQPVSLNLGNDSSLLSISYHQTEPVEYIPKYCQQKLNILLQLSPL